MKTQTVTFTARELDVLGRFIEAKATPRSIQNRGLRRDDTIDPDDADTLALISLKVKIAHHDVLRPTCIHCGLPVTLRAGRAQDDEAGEYVAWRDDSGLSPTTSCPSDKDTVRFTAHETFEQAAATVPTITLPYNPFPTGRHNTGWQ